MTFLKNISNAKHIVIEVEKLFLPSASALYTHILRLHKKVSLVCVSDNINNNLSFLPWFEKIRTTGYSSADLKINLEVSASEMYKLFKDNDISLNKKMATALYAGLLLETRGFLNTTVNGTIFAIASELISCGAEHKICTNFILRSDSLALLRLKALMLKNMLLKENARLAVMSICENDLKQTGARLEDSYDVLEEALKLINVKEVILIKSDESDKILKRIKKEM